MKDYDPIKESSYLMHWNVNNLLLWTMSQTLLVNGFEGVKKHLHLMKAL